jgi:hypothetical protein
MRGLNGEERRSASLEKHFSGLEIGFGGMS